MRSGDENALRVAAYCRVSTDKEDQRNSLSAQQAFFRSYIQQQPGWRLADIFADEGLSGTSAKRRPQFTEMIRRAMAGEIDLIVTKEVSRFARNTVDTLQVTRQLKRRGVGVLFLNDNINTCDNDGEFRLPIMASVAQEESRKISERTRWGQLQAMRRGVVFGNNSIYGYTLKGGVLTVEPEQAAVVRLIYRTFLAERKGAHTIARELTRAGIRPPLRPEGAWSSTMVLRILRNEKYAGDLLQKKFFTTDHLTHRKLPNHGEEAQFYLRDHHEAIVSREEFQAAQAELDRRAGLKLTESRFSARYWYSGKIRCGCCGKSFTCKRTCRANGDVYTRFVCRGHLDGTGRCTMPAVPGPVLLAAARHVLRQLPLNGPGMIEQLIEELKALRGTEGPDSGELERIKRELERQAARKDRAMEAWLDGALSREDMSRLVSRCEGETARLRSRAEELEQLRVKAGHGTERFEALRARLERELEGGDAVLDALIQQITVEPDAFLVEIAELPVRFRVKAAGEGAGRNYRVTIRSCTPVLEDGHG